MLVTMVKHRAYKHPLYTEYPCLLSMLVSTMYGNMHCFIVIILSSSTAAPSLP